MAAATATAVGDVGDSVSVVLPKTSSDLVAVGSSMSGLCCTWCGGREGGWVRWVGVMMLPQLFNRAFGNALEEGQPRGAQRQAHQLLLVSLRLLLLVCRLWDRCCGAV